MKRRAHRSAASMGWMPVALFAFLALIASALFLISPEEASLPEADDAFLLPELEEAKLGRLEVRVIDKENAKPLLYANLVIHPLGVVGDPQGGITDELGLCVFEELLPQEYRVTALFLGKAKMNGQVTVLEDDTQRMYFEMEDTVVKSFDEYVVEGQSVRVQVRDTAFKQNVRSSDLAATLPDGWDSATPPQGGAARSTNRNLASDDMILAQLAVDRDAELWIITKPSVLVRQDPDRPQCGVLRTVGRERLEMPLLRSEVEAHIAGAVAQVEFRQRFVNSCEEKIEVEYVFPLPHDAAVHGFRFEIDERVILGVVRERKEAEELYTAARDRGHRAALLQQERPNIFTQRVANLEPDDEILVTLEYFHPLAYVDGAWEFALPLVVGPRFNPPGANDPVVPASVGRGGSTQQGTVVEYLAPNQRTDHSVGITLDVEAGARIDEHYSVNHVVDVTRLTESRLRVELSPNDELPNKDFVFGYTLGDEAIQSPLLISRGEKESYFSLLITPSSDPLLFEREPVEMIFVLDCSGSMEGWPLAKAKEAAKRALRMLQPSDRFQVVRFSIEATQMGKASVPATPVNVEQGIAYLESLQGGGGTMMIEGIKAALGAPATQGCRRIVSFLTDGFISNEQEILEEIAARRGDTLLFSFGVGQSVNRYLLEGMARQGGGAAAFLLLPASSLAVVDAFYRSIRHPALREVELEWDGLEVDGLTPSKLPDLYAGRPVVVYGRLRGEQSGVLRLRGVQGGSCYEREIFVDTSQAQEHPGIRLLWARRSLMALEDITTQSEFAERDSQVLDLALEHGLVSRLTSMVAVDSLMLTEGGEAEKLRIPVPVPEGVLYGTTVGN